jgi:hypothetical protein
MANGNERLPSIGARQRSLLEIRHDPRYEQGLLIDAAADIAITVARPALRALDLTNTRLRNPNSSPVIDYETLDEHYAAELIERHALGWEEENLHDE